MSSIDPVLPDAWRQVPTLRGRHVSLEPLQAAHAEGLRNAVRGSGLEALWYTNVPAPERVDAYVAAALEVQALGRGAAVRGARCAGRDRRQHALLRPGSAGADAVDRLYLVCAAGCSAAA